MKTLVKPLSAFLFISVLSPTLSLACSCLADTDSKTYEYINKTWYGFKRKWSCNYTCRTSDENQVEIVGWHEQRSFGPDTGLEGICDGAIYEAELSRATLDYVYVLKGAEGFNPSRSKSPELKAWAAENCE